MPTPSMDEVRGDNYICNIYAWWCLFHLVLDLTRHKPLSSWFFYIFYFCFCLVALQARKFESILYCPYVFRKMSLWCCLIFALVTRMFDSFWYCPLVLSKISVLFCLIVALPARIFEWVLHVLRFYVLQDFLLLLLNRCIAHKDIWLLLVQPFCA